MRHRVFQWLQMPAAGPAPVQAGLALGVGVMVFALSYSLLGAARAARDAGPPPELATPAGVGTDSGSVAHRIAPGRVALAAPAPRLDPLASEVQPGDRIAVMAVVPGGRGEGPVAGVVVPEAVVLSGPAGGSGSTLLLEVSSDEALVLAHLIQSGARLSYALWPAAGARQFAPSLDLGAARARLGLEPTPTAVP